MNVRLRAEHRAQLEREARAAFPQECCGLIEGQYAGEGIDILALHPCRNLAQSDDEFEVDPAEQFRLIRALRGTDRQMVGCFHSHPNGKPIPSPRDAAAASEDGFLWLVAAVHGGDVRISAYRWQAGQFVSMFILNPE